MNKDTLFNNLYYRNTKDHKRLLWITIRQQTEQPRRNGKILKDIQLTKTASGRNRKSEWPIASLEEIENLNDQLLVKRLNQ